MPESMPELRVRVEPLRVRTGRRISAEAEVTGGGPAACVVMRLAGTPYAMRMRPLGPGRYGYSLRVPPVVPPGRYAVEFRAAGAGGREGPAVTVWVTVER